MKNKTNEQRMQAVANALNGLTSYEAISILKRVKASIKHNSGVKFEKDYFTKPPERITFKYMPCSGTLEALNKYNCSVDEK